MKISILFICVVALFSCTRAEKQQTTKVSLVLPSFSKKIEASKIKPQKLNPDGTIIPAGLTEIDCYGVLVSGPEDSLRKNMCEMASGATFNVGFFAGGFYPQNTLATAPKVVTLDIPSGVDRVIRLVGFKLNTTSLISANIDPAVACTQFRNVASYESYFSDPYQIAEIGQLELPAGGTKDVTMTAVFDSSLKIAGCRGPDFNSGGGGSNSGGPPAKFAIQFQDGAGSTATKSIADNSCIGVKFQLRDANNASPNLSANPQISAKISLGNPPAGALYSGNTSTGACEAANQITLASGDVTVQFFNSGSGSAFQDINFFFRPNSQSATTPNIQIADVNGALASATLTYNYTSSTLTPFKYALYDFYNNISTEGASTAATKSFVRANECRPLSLCFLNVNGVPTDLPVTGGGKNAIYINDNATNGDVKFYLNSSDCTNSVAASEDWTIQFGTTASPTSSKYFYYKVLNPALTSFSFSVTNLTNGSADVLASPSSELSFGSNFWGVQP